MRIVTIGKERTNLQSTDGNKSGNFVCGFEETSYPKNWFGRNFKARMTLSGYFH